MHALTRPFVLIGAVAIFIAIVTGTAVDAITFAKDMTVLVLEIARAIVTALLEGLFGGATPTPTDPPADPSTTGA